MYTVSTWWVRFMLLTIITDFSNGIIQRPFIAYPTRSLINGGLIKQVDYEPEFSRSK